MLLVLVRHGEPERPATGDRADPGLAEAGAAAVAVAARALAAYRFDACYSSPLRRARQTAGLLRPGAPILVDDDLAEFDRGSEYLHYEDGAVVWSRYLAGDLSPWGTTLAEFTARVVRVADRIADAHPGGTALAVCHGGVVNALTAHALGVADRIHLFEPDYLSAHRFERGADGWRVLSLNEVGVGTLSTPQ